MSEPAATTQQSSGRPRRRWFIKLLFSLILFLILFELAGQVLLWKMKKGWRATTADPRFYYQPSPDPVLTYELKKGYSFTSSEHGRMHINQYGLREDDETIPAAPRKIAILGDSVTFTVDADQEHTLPARVQAAIDPTAKNVKVLNFGVAGYAADQCLAFLKDKNAIYHVTDVVYVLNPNDFALRDSRFEGADDALYRIHHPPLLATPLIVRKAIYRWTKSHGFGASETGMARPEWYLWMFDGTREHTFAAFREMKRYADQNGIAFRVLLVPMRSAYKPDGSYALARMNDEIAALFKSQGVPFLAPRDQFTADPAKYLNPADHLEPAGVEKIAGILRDFLGGPATQQSNP